MVVDLPPGEVGGVDSGVEVVGVALVEVGGAGEEEEGGVSGVEGDEHSQFVISCFFCVPRNVYRCRLTLWGSPSGFHACMFCLGGEGGRHLEEI